MMVGSTVLSNSYEVIKSRLKSGEAFECPTILFQDGGNISNMAYDAFQIMLNPGKRVIEIRQNIFPKPQTNKASLIDNYNFI